MTTNDERSLNDDTAGDKAAKPPVKILSATDIFAAEQITIEPVDVPEWGGAIYVRTMSALQREKYLTSMRKIVGTGKDASVQVILTYGSAKLVALTACDAQGNLLFDRAPETIEKLSQLSAKAMERVVDAAAKLNGLSDDKPKTPAEEAKNASAGLTGADAGLNID